MSITNVTNRPRPLHRAAFAPLLFHILLIASPAVVRARTDWVTLDGHDYVVGVSTVESRALHAFARAPVTCRVVETCAIVHGRHLSDDGNDGGGGAQSKDGGEDRSVAASAAARITIAAEFVVNASCLATDIEWAMLERDRDMGVAPRAIRGRVAVAVPPSECAVVRGRIDCDAADDRAPILIFYETNGAPTRRLRETDDFDFWGAVLVLGFVSLMFYGVFCHSPPHRILV